MQATSAEIAEMTGDSDVTSPVLTEPSMAAAEPAKEEAVAPSAASAQSPSSAATTPKGAAKKSRRSSTARVHRDSNGLSKALVEETSKDAPEAEAAANGATEAAAPAADSGAVDTAAATLCDVKDNAPSAGHTEAAADTKVSQASDEPVSEKDPQPSPDAKPEPAPLTPAAAAALNAPTRSGFRHTKTVLNFSEKGARGQPKEHVTSIFSTATVGSATTSAVGPVLRYRTDLDKPVIHFMFERLGRPVEEISVPYRDEDERDANTVVGEWHFFWMSVSRIRNVFSTAEFRLQDNQIINHFPNHYELTRKDLMYKNIKRYLRENSTGSGTQKRLTLVTAADWVAAAGNGSAAPQPDGSGRITSPTTTNGGTSGGPGVHAYGTGIPSGVSSGSGNNNNGRKTHFHFADSVPITYNIPNDMSMFMEEFKRHPGATWIVKPTSRSQGKGIFLINRIQQLTRWIREKKEVEAEVASSNLFGSSAGAAGNGAKDAGASSSSPTTSGGAAPAFRVSGPTRGATTIAAQAGSPVVDPEAAAAAAAAEKKQQEHLNSLVGTFIVSKYIANPLLIGGKKFDMRLYVLVTSYKPLVAYLHEDGFARFCATRYAGNSLSEDDLGSHLTNVALQKGDEHYNTTHGGKWSLRNLFLYIQARHGPYTAEGLMANIEFLIYHSLKAMEGVMFNDKHSFELYGYDILVDENIKPHLIEVNASPSLSTTTTSDRLLKEQVLLDMLKIVLPPGYPSSRAMSYYDYRTRTDIAVKHKTGFKLLQF